MRDTTTGLMTPEQFEARRLTDIDFCDTYDDYAHYVRAAAVWANSPATPLRQIVEAARRKAPTVLQPMTPADYGIFAGANDGDIAACTADLQTDSPFGDLAVVGMTDSGEAVLEVHGGPDALGYLTTDEPRFRQTYASMHDAAWALTAYVGGAK